MLRNVASTQPYILSSTERGQFTGFHSRQIRDCVHSCIYLLNAYHVDLQLVVAVDSIIMAVALLLTVQKSHGGYTRHQKAPVYPCR